MKERCTLLEICTLKERVRDTLKGAPVRESKRKEGRDEVRGERKGMKDFNIVTKREMIE